MSIIFSLFLIEVVLNIVPSLRWGCVHPFDSIFHHTYIFKNFSIMCFHALAIIIRPLIYMYTRNKPISHLIDLQLNIWFKLFWWWIGMGKNIFMILDYSNLHSYFGMGIHIFPFLNKHNWYSLSQYITICL